MRVIVVLVLLAACKRSTDSAGAKQEFSKKYSCPDDRVTVKERGDIDPATLLYPPSADEAPPDEVKNDPGRLAKWQADHKEQRETVEAGYRRSYQIYEASGCDHAVLLACTWADNAGTSGQTLVCQEKPLAR